MAEFTYNSIQTIEAGAAAQLTQSIGCPKGYVVFDPETGIVILRGVVNNPCARFARYRIVAGSNIAVPEGGTVGEISQALALNGVAVQPSRARVTPTAVDTYWNVTSCRDIDVPVGCCYSFSVQNTSGQSINMQNLNVSVNRVA